MSLDEPVRLRSGGVLRNRIALAPLTNTQSNGDGTLSQEELDWLARRAEGGFGYVSTCATYVSDEGKAWDGQLGASSDDHLPGLRRLAGALREHGAFAVCQLHHGGSKADLAPGQRLSTVDADGVRGATQADLDRVVADFVAAARRCEEAGFDGVEIHGANGYLLTQFLAPDDNPRTDAYGGDLAGRARLIREVVQAVRAAVSPDFAVGVRLTPVDTWTRRGIVLGDGLQVGRWLAEDGVDWVHLSLGDASGSPPHEDTEVPVVTAFRQALPPEVVVLSVGRVWTRDDARRARDAGADVVALGRCAIAHPDWPDESRTDDFEPVRPPWRQAFLAGRKVGPSFVRYLGGFRLIAD